MKTEGTTVEDAQPVFFFHYCQSTPPEIDPVNVTSDKQPDGVRTVPGIPLA